RPSFQRLTLGGLAGKTGREAFVRSSIDCLLWTKKGVSTAKSPVSPTTGPSGRVGVRRPRLQKAATTPSKSTGCLGPSRSRRGPWVVNPGEEAGRKEGHGTGPRRGGGRVGRV